MSPHSSKAAPSSRRVPAPLLGMRLKPSVCVFRPPMFFPTFSRLPAGRNSADCEAVRMGMLLVLALRFCSEVLSPVPR